MSPARTSAPIRYDSLVQHDRIHVSLYTDPRIFADELDRIFHRGWATSRSTGPRATAARSSGSAARRNHSIFPNLFLGETNIAIVQPVGVDECVHWHTPMFWKGVPEFRSRLLRQSEAGMGPASFLMPEDLAIAARNHAGLQARAVEWIELTRGLNRETMDPEGRLVSHVTDETINRALWKHYRAVMTGA